MNESKCLCGEKEDMKHIYNCKYLNSEDLEENSENYFVEISKYKQKYLKDLKST